MAWVLTPSIVSRSRNYITWKIKCISDGNALAATDILSETYMPRDIKPKIQGCAMMSVKADPGSATQPNQAWDFTISDADGDALLTITDISATAMSVHDMSTDIGMYPTIFDKLYIAFPTAADWTSTDAVDLTFTCWVEPGAV